MLKIYINSNLIDIDEKTTVALNYTATDLESPAAVKNAYSKTISIRGTKNNNRIFSNLWKLDNQYGVLNPKKRVDCVITNDDIVVHKGYIQLNTIVKQNDDITYSFTFFGNTGDFFYNLMYNDEGKEKTLYDLYFGFKKNYQTMTKEEEANDTLMQWNALTIYNQWADLNDNKEVDIVAVPTYQGLYDDFDNDKILLNAYNMPTGYTNIFNVTGGTSKEGFYLVESGRELTEWEMRNFRAQQQIPSIKISKVFEAICNPENNGGYEVEIDDDIKTSDYYTKSYMTLSKINFEESNAINCKIPLFFNSSVIFVNNHFNEYWLADANNNIIFDVHSLLKPQLELDILPVIHIFENNPIYDEIFLSYKKNNSTYVAGIGVTIEVYNTSNALEGVSPTYFYTTTKSNIDIESTTWRNRLSAQMGVAANNIRYVYSEPFPRIVNLEGNYFSGDEHLKINLDLNYSNSNKKIKIKIGYFSVGTQIDQLNIYAHKGSRFEQYDPDEYSIAAPFSTDFVSGIYEGDADGTKTTNVNKNMLLGATPSPYKFLTDFAKLFALKFESDNFNKKIKITKHSNYFLNEIKDIENQIDYGQQYTLTPYVTDKKWNEISLEESETYASYLYSKKVKNNKYGSKKINTQVDFTSEVDEILDSTTFKQGIPYILNSQTFNNINITNTNTLYPAVALLNKYKTTSWKNNDDAVEVEQYGYANYNTLPNTDDKFGTKICAFDKENATVDISHTLVMLNKIIDVNNQNFAISDNIEEMYTLNGNPCHLLSYWSSYIVKNGIFVPIPNYHLPTFPLFSTISSGGTAMQIGVPEYTFTSTENTDENNTIYNQFWKKWYEDFYSENATKVEIYVFVKENNLNSLFKKFYSFGGSIWILNKITDWNVTSDKPTKCEFIRVKNKNNYF